jgi:hypothetical protein
MQNNLKDPVGMEVIARLHPMLSSTVVETVPQGETIGSIVRRLGDKHNVRQWYRHSVYVELNGKAIKPELYESTKVYGTDHISVQFCIPEGGGGGGKNILRMVLMIVVVIVSIYFPPAMGLTGLGASVASGAIMVAGSIAVNMLVPPQALSAKGLGHESSEETSIYSISGMRNYNPSYKPLPSPLGTLRYAPPFGAMPYTRIDGNDQHLHADFVWGAGELLVEELRIGETPIEEFNYIKIATNAGKVGDPELKLYPFDVYEEPLSIVLSQNVENIRTTQLNTQLVTLDFVFPRGLFSMDDKGTKHVRQVNFSIYYLLEGSSTWSFAETHSFADNASYPKRITRELNFKLSPGQYSIKVVRTSAESNSDKIYDEMVWIGIKSVKFQDPVTFDIPVAETQIEIKATEQLSGPVDTLNGKVTSVCLDYNYTTNTWIKRPTNNCASLFRYVLEGNGVATPLPSGFVDIPALEEWHDFCRINGFTYNKVHDAQMSVQAVLNDICHAGRATNILIDDLRSVVIDRAKTSGPVQLFTPENSSSFSSRKTFLDEIHGYRVLFNNEDSDYLEDEVVVYTQGYSQSNATLLEALQFPGITNIDQVIALTKYHLATRIYRSEVFSWETDWEHVVCNRGDLVRVSNPAILVSLGSGRIVSVDYLTQTIVIDQEVSIEAQTDYGLVVRTTPSDTQYSEVFTIPVFAADWTTNTFTWTNSFTPVIRRGDLFSFGEIEKETLELIITGRSSSKDLRGTLTAIQYSWNEIQAYMNGQFPVVNSGITSQGYIPSDTPPPPVISFVGIGETSSVTLPDGTVLNRVTVVVSIPSGWSIPVKYIQAEIMTNDGWVRSPDSDPSKPIIFTDVPAGEFTIRVRSVSANGKTSAWVFKTETQVDATPVPSPVQSLTVSGNLFQNDLTWVLPVDFRDSYRVAIYCSPGLNDRSNTGPPVQILSGGTKWSHTGLIPEVQYYYWVRIYSSGVGSKETTPDPLEGWHDVDGSWRDEFGQWDGKPQTSIGGWSDEEGEWHDESGNAWGGIDPYSDPKFSDWYPLNRFGGVQASPITDNKRILDMLTDSIGRGQLVGEINTAIDGAIAGINYQQQFFQNSWTVKIQEIGGRPYMVGMGLVLYPDWKPGEPYVVDQYVWKADEDNVYKCTVAHTSSLDNQPPIQTYWELIPYGKKSGVAIVADQFSVTTPDGTGEVTPFVISGSIVGINGTLIVNGTVRATALSATDVYAMTIQSANYVEDVSGFRLDSIAGKVFLNDTTVISRDSVTGDSARLTAGGLDFFYKDGNVDRLYKSVTRIEPGSGTHGQLITLPGIWKERPKIVPFDAGLQTYSAALGSAQTQARTIGAINLVEYSPRKWRFTITATLSVLASPYSFNHANLAVTDQCDPGTTHAIGSTSQAVIGATAPVLYLSSNAFTCVAVNPSTRNQWLQATISIYYTCGGVTKLVQIVKSSPAWLIDYKQATVYADGISAAISPSGSGARNGYFTMYVQTKWQPDYNNGVFGVGSESTDSHAGYITVTATGLKTSYTLPAGASVAAGTMGYFAIGR